jgi:DNA-binding winged helix-turn-helix (wHTH) protein/Flp pilus assembly protein TadD
MNGQTQKTVVRFGVFEANLTSGDLRKHGLLIRVPGQPFKILAILLERPGEVVSRDELRKNLWSAETFVDFDHSLNSAIKKLREALGDSAENPRYIETLPRQGYRFIAPVTFGVAEAGAEPAPQPVSAAAAPSPGPGLSRSKPVAIAIAILGACGIVWYAVAQRAPIITEQDSIVLADFENRTGDSAFDGTLKKVLEVELSQSPYLNILPDQDMRQTLEYMRRRPDEPITKQVGLEVCQRNNIKAMMTGSIASLGNRYVMTLEALNCATGSVLAGAEVEAESKERVLTALDDSTAKIRRKLGESLGSIRKFGVPVAQATTSSLEALKVFTQGDELRRQGKTAESIPFFKRASELDPQFTLAYARLGAVYVNLSENSLARQYLEKAFQLRERTSERERLYLAARYYENVSGEAVKAIENYEIWRSAYPRDWIPFNNLGNKYTALGQYEKAIEMAREALRLNPNHAFPYEALARAYKRATRYAESKSICEAAIARNLESYGLHSLLYQIAFAEGDAGTLKRQVEWGAGRPTEDETLQDEAMAAATAGRLRDSRELFRRAFAVARKNGFPDNTASAVISQGSVEAAFHNFTEAKELAATAFALEGENISGDAALLMSQLGDPDRAESLADDLVRRYPLDTLVNEVSVPKIRAEVEIRRGQPVRAIELLRNAAPFELRDFTVPYIRGSAYLAAQMGTEAAGEFQKIVKNQGIDPISPYYPLAHIGLAQAYALTGDEAGSHREYEAFFVLWKDADQDIPILQEAKIAYSERSSGRH